MESQSGPNHSHSMVSVMLLSGKAAYDSQRFGQIIYNR